MKPMPAFSSKKARVFEQREISVMSTPKDKTRLSRRVETNTSNQLQINPNLERKRAKYTVEDVQQLCGGISRSTVMREIRRKRLACYRARRTLRFSEEHITKYFERVEQPVR